MIARLVLFLLVQSCAASQVIDDRVKLLEHAAAASGRILAELERTVDRLHALTDNAVLLYAGNTCPHGFRRAHEFENRFLFIDGDAPGRSTPHNANEITASIEKPCDQIISVADSGMVGVCRHTDTLRMEIDTKKLIPHTALRACIPEDWELV